MAKNTTKTSYDEAPDDDTKDEMKTTRTKAQEDDEKKDRERLKKEQAAMTPEEVSKLMTEKSILKRQHETEMKEKQEAFQQKIFELDIQIARGNISTQGRTS